MSFLKIYNAAVVKKILFISRFDYFGATICCNWLILNLNYPIFAAVKK